METMMVEGKEGRGGGEEGWVECGAEGDGENDGEV